MPRAAKPKPAALDDAAPYIARTKLKRAVPGAADDPLLFLREVHVDGEEAPEQLPVFDTCDEVRRKISAFWLDPRWARPCRARARRMLTVRAGSTASRRSASAMSAAASPATRTRASCARRARARAPRTSSIRTRTAPSRPEWLGLTRCM